MNARRISLGISLFSFALFASWGAGCGGDELGSSQSTSSGAGASGAGSSGSGLSSSVSGSGSGGGGQSSSSGGAGGTNVSDCIFADGPGAQGTETWMDSPHQASVKIDNDTSCTRTYTLSTTGPLRDNYPKNPLVYAEQSGQPILRSGHDMLDALYALAVEESRQGSVSSITNGAFNGGNPITCQPGGCFETGRLWTYVWTRDTSYSVALGLGLLDPTRARNSMEFKLSTRRDGTKREIVQDTGSGGSYPISSDRVVWAMGAWELLKALSGAERTAFRDLAYEAIVNTAEHDRLTVWDSKDGLYRGEQSFLDWREQSYPQWTALNTVHLGMSKALGTNIGHAVMLEVASKLATEKGDAAASQKYGNWSSALKDAVRARLWLQDRQQFSAFMTTYLDPSPTQQLDLLGSAFSVLFDVATPAQAAEVIARYPHFPKGAPVISPQQQETAIYHNRAMWPFVTAFWMKAAAKAGNADAIDHALRSLMRGAALNLSNMENFEVVTGANYLAEGSTSGPVVNSQRQLWSVAGFFGAINDVIFGFEATQTGVRFAPKLTVGLRNSMFAGVNSIALNHLSYRGKRVSVVLKLPTVSGPNGVLEVASVLLNGAEIGTAFTDETSLSQDNTFVIELKAGAASTHGIKLLTDADIANYRNVFGPRVPSINNIGIVGDRVQIGFSVAENASDITLNVYRDGVRIAEGLPGSTTSYTDMGSASHATTTYCYSVEAVYKVSGNASQHAEPFCYWGPNDSRIKSVYAKDFQAVGGTFVNNHGYEHYENWGDPSHTLTIKNITASQTGKHLIQVYAANGAGPLNTGITCGVKAVEVWDGPTLVGSGQLLMPHLGENDWGKRRDSNFVPVNLVAGKTYTIVIREDAGSGNMSDFQHFSIYSGMGGQGGRFNKVNISDVKILAIGTP